VGLRSEKRPDLTLRIMIRPHFSPPRLAERLAGRALDEGERSVRLGDLEERFQFLVRERGERRARIWYRGQVMQLLFLAVVNHIRWSFIMFKNNLIIAWRNIKKSKAYSALNILGLAAGIVVFILIMLFVRTELSYDRYHANAKNIYRLLSEAPPGGGFQGSRIAPIVMAPLGPAVARNFPEVLAATRIDTSSNVLIKIGAESFLEKTFFWTDPQTFDIFSFPFIRGDRAAALKDPFSLLVSEREARRLFGPTDPIGRTMTYADSGQAYEFRVAGVFRDIPANSHFVIDIVAPFETMGKIQNQDLTRWSNMNVYAYVLLKPGADAKALDAKLPAFIDRQAGNQIFQLQGQKMRFFLQPLAGVHLYSGANFEISPPGDSRFILLFASIAVLVLVIACVNYMNLAMARSLKRVKEIGLRKVVGAAKGQLVRQFLGDSMMMTFLALLLAVAGVLLVLPAFRAFVERDIAFNPLRDVALMSGLIVLAAVVGAAAGSYPALFASSFQPVSSLKGTGSAKARGRGLRNGLIVFQFAVSIALIICTIGVLGQLDFIRNRDMGYEREQILVLTPQGGINKNLEAFKAELERNPSVLAVTASSSLPNNINSLTFAQWPGKPETSNIQIYELVVDRNFVDLYGLKIVRGRNFSRETASDSAGAFLINETALKAFGWDDPVGREFGLNRDKKARGRIVGVVKDFHIHSLHLPIAPLYISLNPAASNRLSIKIRGQNISQTIAAIGRIWDRFSAGYPFDFSFFDQIFDRAYRTDRRLGQIFAVFALLAIFIACLGLVGLASFAAERRTKEIGIRKVLGASSPGVIILLSREFMKWVVLANVIAWPVGYFVLRGWLQNFAYRMTLTLPMFLGAALAAFFFAAAVISLQTYRTASANPANSLRHE
jgi:putative ABC transport system permease protein